MQKRRGLARALAVLLALGLVGCTPDDGPAAIPSPTPTATPIFASDEEALAAAEEAYEAYQAMEDQIFAEGGEDPDRIRPFASRDALENALSGYLNFRESGHRSIGKSAFVLSVARANEVSAGVDVISAHLCLDVTGVDVVNQQGDSVVSSDRPAFQSFDVYFDLADEVKIVISDRVPSGGDPECD